MAPLAPSLQTDEIAARALSIFEAQRQAIYCRTDRMFAGLMAAQWAGAVLVACCLSPRTWAGTESVVHPHVLAAIFLGGLLSVFPIGLALLRPGQTITRQVIAVSQLLMSALLIHISGGRIATHFHIFGSLAFLAFYRDWRVLLSATMVTAADHFLRGIFWPQSVYGLASAAPWLTAEHAGWVGFTDIFLLISCRQSLQEMSQISLRQAQLEVAETILIQSHETLETRVAQRTEALARVQRRNELLLNSAGEGIYGVDTNGITQFVNPAAAKMLGYDVEEIIGQPMHALLHHTHADGGAYPKQDCSIYRCLHDAETRQVDNEVFWRKDGTAFNVEYIATPICEEGQVLGAVVTFQDITERRQTAEALRESETRYRGLVENSPEAIFVYSEGVLRYVNAAMVRLLGAGNADELVGRANLDFVHSDSVAAVRERMAQVVAGTGNSLVQLKYVRLDGSIIDVEAVSMTTVYDGKPAGQVLVRDITERKHAETALLESETRYRGLVEHSPEAVIVYVESRFVYANAAAVTLLAASCAEDLIGCPVLDFVHPSFHALARERAARSQSLGKSSPLTQQKYVRSDGKVIDVEAVSIGIVYGGKPAGQVLIRDITERKRAEESILALNSELLHAYDATIEGWSRALDLRDHETEGHSRRVTEMTLRLAQAVGIPEAEMVHVRRGALLHDIGKMGVPDAVLLKPGPLDDDEWITMRRHPALAKEMLDPAEFLRPALTIPYCHHEKWDGSGYPQGLRGDEIPLSARLFALVDVWDALSSDRPYRAAWPPERVKDHLHGLAGTHFDPDLVSVFLELLDDGAAAEAHALSRAA